MAKVKLNAAGVTAARAIAATGSDADLPAADRRNRTDPNVAEVELIAAPKQVSVLGAGRGRGWYLVAWRDEGLLNIGTMTRAQIEREP